MTSFAKPENALKRADELVSINAGGEALRVLHSVITAKKFRTWQPILEKIMLKYIDLCVEQRKGKMAKDGLHQYRVTCQQYSNSYTSSLEVVVKHFLAKADERAKEAQSKADQIILDIDDLEAEESSESLLLTSVSGEDSKDRTDREIVTPWLKFLWETYRTVLEILRNNNKLEHVYQDTAQQAFNFCLKYKRHTEFRRLSEMLRTHLANIGKNQNQAQAINLNSPESLQRHLDTRFAQLNAAADLELWQEAYRSVEDIHGLIAISKKVPKPQIMASYFQKLAQIFWVSSNPLFHTYALQKFFQLSKAHNKSLSEEESKSLASQVLLAALSIPQETSEDSELFDIDLQKERNARMAALLSFQPNVTVSPKREVIVDELVSKNYSVMAYPELSDFFFLFEKRFDPLRFSTTLKSKLDFVAAQPSLKQYAKPLEQVAVIRQLQQLSKVYDVLKISEFSKLVPHVNIPDLERVVVEAVKKKYLDLRFDHQHGVINFKPQSLTESESLRRQLITMASQFQSAVRMIQPEKEVESVRQQKRKDFFTRIVANLENEHQKILRRKVLIEKKKEESELQAKLKAQQEDEERQRREAQLKAEEDARLAAAALERERLRKAKEEVEKKKRDFEAWAEYMRKRGADVDTSKVIDKVEQGAIDPEEFIKKRIEQHEQQQKEIAKKYKKLEQRMDWFERAKREEERSLLVARFEQGQKEDQQFYVEQMTGFLAQHKEAHERDLIEKKRLQRMVGDKAKFEESIVKARKEDYARKKKERDERLAIKKAQLKEERETRRAEEERRRVDREREQERVRKEREEFEKTRLAADEISRAEREKELERRREEAASSAPGAPGKYVPPTQRRPEEAAGRYVPPTQRSEERDRDDSGWRRPGPFDRDERPMEREREEPWRRQDRGPDREEREDRDREGAYVPPSRRGPEGPGRFGDRDRRPDDRFGDRDRRPDDRFGDRDRRGPDDRFAPRDRRDDRFGGDRDRPPRGPDDRFGGDRDRRPDDRFGDRDRRGPDDRFGGDRDRLPPRGGDDRFGGDRDRLPPRGEDRFGGDRDRLPPRGGEDRFGGDRDRRGPGPDDRDLRRPDDRDRPPPRFGDRDRPPRGPDDRFGGDRDRRGPGPDDRDLRRPDDRDRDFRRGPDDREGRYVPPTRRDDNNNNNNNRVSPRDAPSGDQDRKISPRGEPSAPRPAAPAKQGAEEEVSEDGGFTTVQRKRR